MPSVRQWFSVVKNEPGAAVSATDAEEYIIAE